MKSGYVINVARLSNQRKKPKHYEHLFRTDAIQDATDAADAVFEIEARFPKPEFNITVTLWDCRGQTLTLKQLRNTP